MNQFGADPFVNVVKGRNRLPDSGSGVDSLGMQQPLEEMNGVVEVLVREGQDREHAFE